MPQRKIEGDITPQEKLFLGPSIPVPTHIQHPTPPQPVIPAYWKTACFRPQIASEDFSPPPLALKMPHLQDDDSCGLLFSSVFILHKTRWEVKAHKGDMTNQNPHVFFSPPWKKKNQLVEESNAQITTATTAPLCYILALLITFAKTSKLKPFLTNNIKTNTKQRKCCPPI